MERDDWECEGDDYVEISVPTELVKRVVNGVSDVMREWEAEATSRGEEFNLLIGMAAVKLAFDFMDTSVQRLEKETMQ